MLFPNEKTGFSLEKTSKKIIWVLFNCTFAAGLNSYTAYFSNEKDFFTV